jgi:hypothetical protein
MRIGCVIASSTPATALAGGDRRARAPDAQHDDGHVEKPPHQPQPRARDRREVVVGAAGHGAVEELGHDERDDDRGHRGDHVAVIGPEGGADRHRAAAYVRAPTAR